MFLSEVTNDLGGRLIRDGEFDIHEFCTASTDKPFLTFLEKEKFIDKVSPYASCMLCTEALADKLPDNIKGIYVTENPKYDFYVIHNKLTLSATKKKTVIASDVTVGNGSVIASNNVIIGDGVVIDENVVINENVEIGRNTHIYANTVIGGKSFDFAKNTDGVVLGWLDAGKTIIGENVEVLSMAHIAQATIAGDFTVIGDNAKIDSFVHIGHSAKIGKRALVSAGAVIGGNASIGDDSWVGINATVSNRIVVGNNARVSLGAVVTKNVSDNCTVSGNFAISHERFLNNLKNSIKD